MNRLTLLGLLLVLSGCASVQQRYENQRNPTEYTFDVPMAKVIEVLKDPNRKLAPPPEPLHGSFISSGDFVYGFGLFDYYTKRYWTGAQEKREDVDPPEAGRIGTIQADFEVRVVSRGANQTLVSIGVKSFQQQIGRQYTVVPHFHKGPVIVDVKSDTYFEYLFLSKLGELIGVTNMPPIRGQPD